MRRISPLPKESPRLAQGPLQASAQALSPGLVTVALPESFKNQPVEYIAALESVEIFPTIRRVVVNERTGTVIIGEERAHHTSGGGSRRRYVAVKTSRGSVNQPFANGRTVVSRHTLEIKELESRQLIELPRPRSHVERCWCARSIH